MKLTMLLADAAQAVGGKLYVLGGGWSITTAPTGPSAIAVKLDIPWDEANRRHTLKFSLLDEDGRPVVVPTPIGDRPLEIEGQFEVGRPPGLKPGTSIDFTVAFNLGPLPLQPDRRYVWRCTINGRAEEGWALQFSTRAALLSGVPA